MMKRLAEERAVNRVWIAAKYTKRDVHGKDGEDVMTMDLEEKDVINLKVKSTQKIMRTYNKSLLCNKQPFDMTLFLF